MDIDRYDLRNKREGLHRIKFCLDQLEKAEGFLKGIDWSTKIVSHLTIEEIVGALVSAGQDLE